MNNFFNLILVIFSFLGIYFSSIYFWRKYLYYSSKFWRRKFIDFLLSNDIYQTCIFGTPGTGKTLLLTILAHHPLLVGSRFTSYPVYDPQIGTLSWNNIDLESKTCNLLPMHSNLFFDEIGMFGPWNDPKKASEEYPGVLTYLKTARHFHHRLFYTNQRLGGGVWNEIRALCRLFIQMDGFSKYHDFTLLKFRTSDNEAMLNSQKWTFLISPSDFDLYDSYWMKPLSVIKNDFVKSVNAVDNLALKKALL